MALLESSWSIEKSDDEQTGLGFLRIDPSTIKFDSCGPWSNDVGAFDFSCEVNPFVNFVHDLNLNFVCT
jgi:hypothetical protein